MLLHPGSPSYFALESSCYITFIEARRIKAS